MADDLARGVGVSCYGGPAGNTLAARAGASTKELMARMGHGSMAAAIIYQHATSEADRAIAQAVNVQLAAELAPGEQD